MGWSCPKLFLDTTKLHNTLIKVLDKHFQVPVMAKINYHGWVGGWGVGVAAGSNETKANSAQFDLNWGLAELGNKTPWIKFCPRPSQASPDYPSI